jgi:hypothetical protein
MKTQDATTERELLTALLAAAPDFFPEQARVAVRLDPNLVRAGLELLSRTSARSPSRFLAALFKDPGRFGLTRTPSGWTLPREEVQPDPVGARIQRQMQERQAERKALDEQLERERRQWERFQALPATQQEEIRERVRASKPHSVRWQSFFKAACLVEMQRIFGPG